MFSVDDTIVAIATPLGRGGIGVVRLAGPDATQVARALIDRSTPLIPRNATFATLAAATSVPQPAVPLPQPPSLGAAAASAAPQTPPERGTSVPRPDVRDLQPPSLAAAVEATQPPSLAPAAGPATSVPPRDDPARDVRDQVVVTFFPKPHSYTGDDVVEISAHGSPVVLQGIVQAAIGAGARLAEPGEFTLRAFLNGKLDLVQAEAVADLIDAVTPLQARAAFDQLEGTLTASIREIESTLFDLMARLEASLDFPDEGYHFVQRDAAANEIVALASRIDALLANAARGRLIREGAQVAIIGTPNVGKSSLFNALLNANRAIVTPIAGTTRDLLTERADLGGISVSLVDTAGIRDSDDVVEREGVLRARGATSVADLTVLMLDRSRPLSSDDRVLIDATVPRTHVVVVNKTDLAAAWYDDGVAALQPIELSLKSGVGLQALIDRMTATLAGALEVRDQPLVTNVRHITLLENARSALSRASNALIASRNEMSEEFVLADLQDAAHHLQEITGQRTSDDLLAHIFKNFCIGK